MTLAKADEWTGECPCVMQSDIFLNSPFISLDALKINCKWLLLRKRTVNRMHAISLCLTYILPVLLCIHVFTQLHMVFCLTIFSSNESRSKISIIIYILHILYVANKSKKCHVLGRYPCIHVWINIFKKRTCAKYWYNFVKHNS